MYVLEFTLNIPLEVDSHRWEANHNHQAQASQGCKIWVQVKDKLRLLIGKLGGQIEFIPLCVDLAQMDNVLYCSIVIFITLLEFGRFEIL